MASGFECIVLCRKLLIIGLAALSARRQPKTIAISAKHRELVWRFLRGLTQKGRREAGLFTLLIRRRSVLRSVYGSVLRDDRATPVEAIVDASLHNMVVGAEAAERSESDRSGERAGTEIIVLIFDLGRPVLGEHVFEAGADGVTILMTAAEREGGRNASDRHGLVVVGVRITALHVEQGRTPSVADAAGHRTQSALVVGVGDIAGEDHAVVIVGKPAVLTFDTEDPIGGELVVVTRLQTAEESAVAVAAGGEASEIVVATESTADVTADVEAGPVVERRDISRSLGVGGAGRKVGGKCWHGRADGDEGHSGKQKLLH